MFRKILIANRGEIAVRIARACREMGISPIAVYSEADRAALHVRVADEAVEIGPAPSRESYLRGDRIIAAALECGAEAIHPGYGFLSESASFAQAVRDAGLVLIGPSPEAMQLMGSKTVARRTVRDAGAPVVPGTVEPVTDPEEARRVAAEIGYPVMLKASAGGGGKGMRLVHSADELASALERAGSEAAAAFGDASVYIEKAIVRPRHIEIQLLADRQGNCVYLGERECSMQRRHQKIVEECPAPFNDASLRKRMGEAAVKIAKAANYEGAGTIEFLVDADRNFYFLEMNTRLQVEHPVTELVTGRDLVHAQIRIAAGEPLWFTQDDVSLRGHAIEVRIYAEDPESGFIPSSGRITRLREPAGPGIRVDSGVYEGWEVAIHYDPLLAKLAVWAETRTKAIARLRRALTEYDVGGIKSTLPYFRALCADENYLAGDIDTQYLDRWIAERTTTGFGKEPVEELVLDLALVAAAMDSRDNAPKAAASTHDAQSNWKRAGRARSMRG
ncbi:MAG: acetyl-CoA carboxylase biotin carboxylase subunit [Blastocatellia bacterium]|jgi:acetyl-CoA carboxylase biotin carboxylase subunit|nr:acetyl-CoA carboxylase biotin carboxylase subunit [Blastocatellia bacterium]